MSLATVLSQKLLSWVVCRLLTPCRAVCLMGMQDSNDPVGNASAIIESGSVARAEGQQPVCNENRPAGAHERSYNVATDRTGTREVGVAFDQNAPVHMLSFSEIVVLNVEGRMALHAKRSCLSCPC